MKLVPYGSRVGVSDLSKNPDVAKAAVHLASSFFGLDLTRVEFSGVADHAGAGRPGSLVVNLWDGDASDSAWRHVAFEANIHGFIDVRPIEGSIQTAVSRDLIGDLKRGWNLARGLPEDMPAGSCAHANANGGISVELFPLI